MIHESIKEYSRRILGFLNIKVLLILSIATSIDALAVGLSLIVLDISIMTLAIVTGIVTFSLCFVESILVANSGILRNRVEVLGGIILIIIGLRVLLDHLGII
jgi:putative Mn2+ efflux pump MntP